MRASIRWPILTLIALAACSQATVSRGQDINLLNVSYDPTRELYEDINPAFAADYKAKTGHDVHIEQSHGGSGKQAHAVLDGLRADVVTLALAWDITALEKAGLVNPGWQDRLPQNASPYTSTIVFLVRKGNPKRVQNWDDLVKDGVQVITANPKTGGGARWNFLAAWGHAAGAKADNPKLLQQLDEAKGNAFVSQLYRNVPVLDAGARGSTVTFAQKNIGDVLIAWENEAWLAQEEFGKDKFDIVYPTDSILAEPPVAVVDKVVDDKGTRAAAEAYLKFLYTPAAQEIIATNHYRPRDPAVLQAHALDLPAVKLFTVANLTGTWANAQAKFFADGGVFDQIYKPTH